MARRRAAAVGSVVAVLGFAVAWLGGPGPVGAAPKPVPVGLSMFTEQVPIPPMIDARAGGAVGLDEVVGTHRFHSQLDPTPSFGYLPTAMGVDPADEPRPDVYLGPTIEVQRGAPVEVTVTNELYRPAEPDEDTPDDCAARELAVVHPLAEFFDESLHNNTDLDRCAPFTAMHLHGGHSASAPDGGPMEIFRPAGLDPDDFASGAGAYTYRYENDQEATALWVHDHALGITRLNPAAGLAAFYLVRDAFDTGRPGNPLGLPAVDGLAPVGDTGMVSAATAYEVPLVLQDRAFNADGTLDYPTASTDFHPTWAPEAFGDVATVNGKAWPVLDVDRGLYRLRLLNGSNARFYRLNLVDAATGRPADVPVFQIGSDGGMLNRPVPVSSLRSGLLIAPGERADVLVDFRGAPAGARYEWVNNAKAPFPSGAMDLRRIMQFAVGTADGFTPPPGTPLASIASATLRGGPGQAPAVDAPVAGTSDVRTVFLNEIIDPETGIPVEALENNLPFIDHDTGEPITVGIAQPLHNSVEVWQIVNTTADTHPIHLHLAQFRVIDRQRVDAAAYLAAVNPKLPGPSVRGTGVQGSGGEVAPPDPTPYLRGRPAGPAANETGWKDTVVAHPGEVLRILVPFGGQAAGIASPYTGDAPGEVPLYAGAYVWHCHILEHEENDMMQPFEVVP